MSKAPHFPSSLHFPSHFAGSIESLEESLLPSRDTEAEILFTPPGLEASLAENRPPVKLGGADLGAPGHSVHNAEEEGMIMGPSHPIFERETVPPASNPFLGPSELPVPPGARFDPISPVGPGFYSPGEPDFDDLLPPGGPIHPSIRPPRGPRLPGSKTFPSAPFGHPHGAPPGEGNPPFFM